LTLFLIHINLNVTKNRVGLTLAIRIIIFISVDEKVNWKPIRRKIILIPRH